MDRNAAKSGSAIVAQIDALEAVIAQIEVAAKEKWLVTVVRVSAPVEGASQPADTTFDVILSGHAASAENSALTLATALKTYQATLDALNAQLAAL